MNIEELDIEVPWGKIAVKVWGNKEDPAVLAVHGIMDNAGSFDGLIPLLPKYYYICIDLPGHGKSSHFPPHLPIFTISYLMVYTLVMQYFKRDKFIIMGHSYGGQIALLFAQIYPERVEKLIMLDTVHLITVPSKYFKEAIENRLHQHFEMQEKLQSRSAPQYTYEEALNRMLKVRATKLTEKAAKSLLARILIPVGNNKFEFSLDQRNKYCFNPLNDARYAVDALKATPVQCPILIVFGIDSRIRRDLIRPILNHLKKQKNVTVKYVPGDHDVHQAEPEIVAPLVANFLSVQKIGNFDINLLEVRPIRLTEKTAKSLLNRMLIPAGNDKFHFSLDQRLKSSFNPLQDSRYSVDTLKGSPVQCPVLIVLALENRIGRYLLRDVLNHLKKQPNVSVKYVSGNHDVHQLHPEIVGPVIAQFLTVRTSKL